MGVKMSTSNYAVNFQLLWSRVSPLVGNIHSNVQGDGASEQHLTLTQIDHSLIWKHDTYGCKLMSLTMNNQNNIQNDLRQDQPSKHIPKVIVSVS